MTKVSYEDVVHFIGDVPIGDPTAMRAYAWRLQAEASAIAGRANSVTGRVDGTPYECPAADRLRAGAANTDARLQRLAARLDGLATDILRGADRVEQEQQAWQGEFDRVLQKLEHDVHL